MMKTKPSPLPKLRARMQVYWDRWQECERDDPRMADHWRTKFEGLEALEQRIVREEKAKP